MTVAELIAHMIDHYRIAATLSERALLTAHMLDGYRIVRRG